MRSGSFEERPTSIVTPPCRDHDWRRIRRRSSPGKARRRRIARRDARTLLDASGPPDTGD